MQNDKNASANMLKAAGVAVLAFWVAIFAAPWLASWIAENGTAAAGTHSDPYYYDYRYEENASVSQYWPAGSSQLFFAFLIAVTVGGFIGWFLSRSSAGPIDREPDPKAKRRKKAQVLIDAVRRRGDLSTGEKESFESSALALADADDPTSIRAADLVGAGDAVTAANGLASESENDFLQLLRHSVNIALPFSDRTARKIDKRRTSFADIDKLLKALDDCEDLRKKVEKYCKYGPHPQGDCGCDGHGACGKDTCRSCCASGKNKGNHARLDVVWD